jgi:NHL repeat
MMLTLVVRAESPYAITTFAGSSGNSGAADGVGNTARFTFPFGIAIDSGRNLYIADSSNHTIRRVTSAGVVTTFAGVPRQLRQRRWSKRSCAF